MSRPSARDQLIGEHPAFQRVVEDALWLARRNVPVLLQGPRGSGKDLLARLMHEASPRAHKPFIAINCASLNSDIIESELFGYERGAFTGATARQVGLVERADGGSMLLDEVAELRLDGQACLLRFLESGKIRRVGGHEEIPVNVRIITATLEDLPALCRRGRFREDLFDRLAKVILRVPPLDARGEDVLIIAHHLLAHDPSCLEMGPSYLTPDAERWLRARRWPGNVRELQRALLNAQLFAKAAELTAAALAAGALVAEEPQGLSQARRDHDPWGGAASRDHDPRETGERRDHPASGGPVHRAPTHRDRDPLDDPWTDVARADGDPTPAEPEVDPARVQHWLSPADFARVAGCVHRKAQQLLKRGRWRGHKLEVVWTRRGGRRTRVVDPQSLPQEHRDRWEALRSAPLPGAPSELAPEPSPPIPGQVRPGLTPMAFSLRAAIPLGEAVRALTLRSWCGYALEVWTETRNGKAIPLVDATQIDGILRGLAAAPEEGAPLAPDDDGADDRG